MGKISALTVSFPGHSHLQFWSFDTSSDPKWRWEWPGNNAKLSIMSWLGGISHTLVTLDWY